jgi:aminoglycoside phosphotransferase (APT) family kinase protein
MTTLSDNRELGVPADVHRVNEATLVTYLREHIAGFAGDCTIHQFLGGQSNPTYLIEDTSGTYVLRKKPPGTLLPSAHAVDREFRVISALAGSNVPVPQTRILCEDETVVGQVFYVMDYVPGRVLTEREMPGCTPSERTAMFHSMASVLGALHSVDYLKVGLDDFGRPSKYVARQVARWSQQYEASKIENCDAMDNVIEWLTHNDPDDEHAAIVHGDYRPGNVIFHSENPDVAAVLDWELSTIGHPLADLGYFLMPYRLVAAASPWGLQGLDLDGLGIPPEAAVVDTYASASRRDSVESIDYYIVFSMFRLAAILAGVLRRGIDGNASDPRAIERGRTYSQLATVALGIARKS